MFRKKSCVGHIRDIVMQRSSRGLAAGFAVALVAAVAAGPGALASTAPAPEKAVAERAREAWENGATTRALDILAEGIQSHPDALALHRLRGDVLSVSRRSAEALDAYDAVLAGAPEALDVRWAKWSVLLRTGREEEAIAELQRIAKADPQNPLIHLRLAQELRKLDRLEESLQSYKTAVQLAPDLLTWRMGLARAYFDVLDYLGAYEQVQYVLERVPPGSPLELPAQNMLSIIYGSGKDRGRRFTRIYTPDVTAEQLKEWALMRGEAWRVFSAGRYAEAEPMYRNLLELNPRDPTAAHQLGVILMELGRCEEALPFLRMLSDLDSSEGEYWDSVYRVGRCLAELERWPEALVQFQVLYATAVEFEKRYKNVPLPPGALVLDKEKMARWVEKIRPHVPEADRLPPVAASDSPRLSEAEMLALLAKRAAEVEPQETLDKRASLMGRDADFSWFRFVIPAGSVMRDDIQTGSHEFIPVDPADSFPATQREIYLVFRLVTASYDAVPLAAQCWLEATELTKEPRGLAPDKVIMSMGDQSGYFVVSPGDTGWTPGLYRCGLFEGERTSAETQVDEVRFRILERRMS